MSHDEIQHRAIGLLPLGLCQVEREGWRILHGQSALNAGIGSKPSATGAICPGFG
jgi:hypothetical protein